MAKRTYREKRSARRGIKTIAITTAALAIFPLSYIALKKGINSSTPAALEQTINISNRNARVRLNEFIQDTKAQYPKESHGWRYYAAQDREEYLCVRENASESQLADFYSKLNDNQEGPIYGQTFSRPLWECK